jgi:hypothetical protein
MRTNLHQTKLRAVAQFAQFCVRNPDFAYAPQPNCGFNADANIGHAFGIFMAYVGSLQPSASGAG